MKKIVEKFKMGLITVEDTRSYTVIDLLYKIINKVNELIGVVITQDEQIKDIEVNSLSKEDYAFDITYKRKIDGDGNFTGSWYGFKNPNEINVQLSDLEKIERVMTDGIDVVNEQLTGNAFGWECINIIGDSITQGANCPDIDKDSWVGILRRNLANDLMTPNHGFESIYSPIQNALGVYTSAHSVNTVGSWTLNEDYRSISLCNMSSTENGAIIKIKPKTGSKYCKVLFNAVDGGGSFNVYLANNPTITVSANSNVGTTGTFYTNNIDLTLANGELFIMIEKTDDKLVEIVGVQYFNDESKPMIQNYARTGAKLSLINPSIIPSMTQSKVSIFSLGHNDQFDDDLTNFKEKMSLFVENYQKNGSKVVVVDTIWDSSKTEHKGLLNKMANDLGGIYIDLAPYHTMNGFMSDSSHPSPLGHQVIANIVCQRLGLGLRTKGSSMLYHKPIKVGLMNDTTLLYDNSFKCGNKVTLDYGVDKQVNFGEVVGICLPPKSEQRLLSGGNDYKILTNGLILYNGQSPLKLHEINFTYEM